jgi:hypothetical protein
LLFACRRYLQLVLLLAGLLTLMTAAYSSGAFRAPARSAGNPADTPSGYTITNVSYGLRAGDPRQIDSVRFDLHMNGDLAPKTKVQAKLIRSSSIYTSCSNIPARSTSWQCPVSGVTVAQADELTVRVVSTPQPPYSYWLPIIGRPAT